jgi:hypothetical protein
MARGMVPACRDNRPSSSMENRRKTTPDRPTGAYLLGPIYGSTPFTATVSLAIEVGEVLPPTNNCSVPIVAALVS